MEAAGRVELGDSESAALVRTKAVHVTLILLSVLVAVWSKSFNAASLPIVGFWLAGVAEAFDKPRGEPSEQTVKWRSVAKVTGETLLGLFGMLVLFVAAFVGHLFFSGSVL